MSDGSFKLDESGAIEMLESLSTKKIMNIEKKALRKAANELRKEARSNLRRAMPNANKRGKYKDTLVQGVLSSTYEVAEGMEAKVHIMGVRDSSSGTFRTRFFETGTVQRKTKKGYNRGAIKPINFFGSAIDASKDKVASTLDEELSKAIQKIADKKYE